MNKKISVVIIALNEESNLDLCLTSCKDFDEIIVVDSGITDQTIAIAKRHGAIVVHQEWLGFGPQKQFAVNHASNDWVLSVDADEILSEDLIDNIIKMALTDRSIAYALNRRSYFLGKEVKHSGWNPDWVIRLFNKTVCHFTDDLVHERITGFASLHKLNGLMHHNTYPSEKDIQEKTRKYGLLGKASRTKDKNKFLSALWAFIRTFILKGGFLDGLTGLKIALMNARTTFIKYS